MLSVSIYAFLYLPSHTQIHTYTCIWQQLKLHADYWWWKWWCRHILGYVKVVIGFYQVTATFLLNFSVQWPGLLPFNAQTHKYTKRMHTHFYFANNLTVCEYCVNMWVRVYMYIHLYIYKGTPSYTYVHVSTHICTAVNTAFNLKANGLFVHKIQYLFLSFYPIFVRTLCERERIMLLHSRTDLDCVIAP